MPKLLKKVHLLIALIAISFSASAQVPNLLNYQGVARNAVGNPLPNQTMNLRLSVHNLSASGTTVYSETRVIKTNLGGLFSVQIGGVGTTSATGTIGGVNWLSGDKYLQVEIDPTSNNNYLNLGTIQLVSVPYAFNAGSANNAVTVTTNANLSGAVTSIGNITSLAASPALTGVPTAPTAAPGTNTTQIATTEFVKAAALTGTTGPRGFQGLPGADGAVGPQGPAGPQGVQGPAGATGSVANVDPISVSSTANGASIAAGVLSLAPANATYGGVVTTGVQTFAGTKTFNSTINGSVSGNAATATKLAASKNINGVAFDGSGDIIVTADAGSLTGTSLKSTVTGSSLTSVGTLANLTVTNPIAGSVTGNAATANNLTGLTTSVATLNNLSGTNTGDQTLPTLSSLGAVASNAAIIGATNTKITFDAKGLVIAGAAASTADIAASNDKNYVTNAQQTLLGNTSGTNTGDNATNNQYSGLVSNATHTGDATGATDLTVVKINGTLMSGLATGILKNTTTTGVPSIALAADFPTLNQNTTGTAANVTGMVAVANGGTGATTLTANNVLLGNGTSALQGVAPGASGNVLTSNGTTWTSAVVSAANAGTLSGTTLAANVVNSSLTSVGTIATGTWSGTPIAVANGGTNSTATATAGGIGYGTGTAHAYTSVGTTGQLLSSNGTGVPTWVTPSSGLPTTGNTAGDMLYWNGSAWVKVAAGLNGQTLTFKNGAPTWGNLAVAGQFAQVISAGEALSTTGKIWMDRNLGATQVATSITDANSYGDLYQWGRGADGHQVRTSATTSTLSNSNTPGSVGFITTSTALYDWRSSLNSNLWQGVSGVNNPCPSGFRLPTEAEWITEKASWSSSNAAGAFGSPLKLPIAGYRSIDGSLRDLGTTGLYWSSTTTGGYAADPANLTFVISSAILSSNYRAFGFSVRCIKD